MRKFFYLFMLQLLAFSVLVNAQQKNVTGTITDQKGQPVPFASVLIKGSKKGVSADAEGTFVISVKPGTVLIVTGTGITSKEVTVGSAATLNVQVNFEPSVLSEVVVTALGVKREAKSLGFSTAKIDSKELAASAPVNVASGVTGKVSGAIVQLTNSGVDPDNIRITLRGNRSFLGNNQALIIVDNVPVDNSYLAQLNPNDVESINVLKGGTAAALYGSDASNGVMIVTTKQGSSKKGKPTITVSNATTLEKISFIPKLQYDHGSASSEYEASDAVSYTNPSNLQNGYVPFENQSFSSPFAGGSPFGGDSIIIGFPTASGKVQKIPFTGLSNEFKDFWNTGVTSQTGLSVSSGDDVSRFYLSAQYLSKTGITPGDQLNRTNIRLNASRKYGAFRINAEASYAEKNMNVAGSNANFYYQLQNIAPQVPFASYSNTNAPFADLNTYYNAYALNPFWYLTNQRNITNRKDLNGNVDMALDITKWLSVDYTIGVNEYFINQQGYTNGINFSPYGTYLAYNSIGGDEAYFVGNQLPNVSTSSDNVFKLYSNAKLTFHKKFGDFGTNLILGNVVNQAKENYLSNGSSTLLNIPNFYNVAFREGVPNVGQDFYESRNYGNFADLSLSYRDFIFLHGSYRTDNNSLLNPQYRNYYYPGGDIAIVLSDAIPALKNNPYLSFLKLNGSLTKVGNISVNPYQIDNVFGSGPGFPFGQLPGLTSSYTLAAQNLKPEFTTAHEFGGEVGFLKNRIDIKANYFSEKTTNETVPVSVSAATGYQSSLINIGEMDNKGVEIDLNVTPIKLANGLKWDIGLHYTHYINKVVSLGTASSLYISNGPGTSNSYAVVGKSYAQLEVNDWLRDPANGKVIVDANTGLPSKAPGLADFGTTNPTQTLGINSALSYKGFTLGFVLEYRGGNVIYNGTGVSLDVDGLSERVSTFGLQKFVYPNSEVMQNGKLVQNTNITVNDGGVGFWGNFGYFPGSVYVTSAAFWSLKNVSLSYVVPQKYLERAGLSIVKQVSIGLVGSNLLLFVPKLNTWTNPEFSEDTGNATGTNTINETPPTRTFGANVIFTF